MPKKKIKDLQFPAGGLFRAMAHQQQGPYTSPDCLNVRLFESLEARARGGSRPGLGKAYYDLLGSGNPVRMLSSVPVVINNGLTYTEDNFQGATLGGAWTAAAWTAGLPTIFPSNYANAVFGTTTGAIHAALTTIDVSLPYQIDMFISPFGGVHNGNYQIFARGDSNNPATLGAATNNRVIATLTLTGSTGAYSGNLTVYVAGVPTVYAFAGGSIGYTDAGVFTMHINGNTINCSWHGVNVVSQVVAAPAGERFGFGMECTVAGNVCLVDNFRIQYQTNNKAQVLRNILVASANGQVNRETFLGTLGLSATTRTLASDRLLQARPRLQKLYIADNSNPAALGTDGVRGTGNDRLDAASVADWTTIGANLLDYVAILSGSLGGGIDGTYTLTTIAAGELTLGANWNTGPGATCTYRIERAPKVYDPLVDTLTLLTATSGKGQVPSGNPLIAVYRDRIVLAGAPVAPHVWYMSRAGDPLDWDYAATAADTGRAVAGSSNDAGQIGQPIQALVAYSDDFMLFGCDTQLWVLRGDPAHGGQVDNLSRSVGIVGQDAWCHGPNAEIVFLSREGLFELPSGPNSYPQPLSRNKLPREFLDLDRTTHTILMAYDTRDRGIHIYLTPAGGGTGQLHWFIDWQTKSFWPVRIPNASNPTAIHEFASSNAKSSAVLLGSYDGYVRRYKDDFESDDGTQISSFVQYGPIRLSNNDYNDGKLLELIGVLDNNSGQAAYSILVGDTHQIATGASAFATGTWSAGLNYKDRQRARGPSMILKVANAATRRWAIERVTATVEQTGKHRKHA